jgi:hypothetical protein
LQKVEGEADVYTGSFVADKVGKYSVKLPAVTGEAAAIELPLEVALPGLELAEPQVDRTLLNRLSAETMGQQVSFAQARSVLPSLIPSAAKIIPLQTSEPLWDAPLAMLIFVLLITVEWVLRKVYGML